MTTEPDPSAPSSTPSGLAALAAAVPARGPAPVHLWDPPYCGDIGLEILADGSWMYQGSPIGRRALVVLFASILRKDADGKTYLVTPVEKIDVRVVDAPFIAVEMAVTGTGSAQDVAVRTNLDTWVRIDGDHPIRFVTQAASGGLKPYVVVRGRLEALLSRAVYLDLVALAVEGCEQNPGFWSGGQWWGMAA